MNDERDVALAIGEKWHKQIREALEYAHNTGHGMLCMRHEDGVTTVDNITPEQFFKAIGDITPQQENLLRTLLSMDFADIERRVIGLAVPGIRGTRASLMVCDDLVGDRSMTFEQMYGSNFEPDEESVVVGKRLVNPNKKTKGKAHNLPFYLGNKRRY